MKQMPEPLVQMLDKQKDYEDSCIKDAKEALSQGMTFHANELLHIAKMSEIRREHFMQIWEIENHG